MKISKYPKLDYKLCIIKDNTWAYFTNAPHLSISGDDFDDAPYEHNAGLPYLSDNKYEILKIAYISDLVTPTQFTDKYYSINDIMLNKAVPWLSNEFLYPQISQSSIINIYAGESLENFINIIIINGGEIYSKVKQNEVKL
jgi:hypothetical protein